MAWIKYCKPVLCIDQNVKQDMGLPTTTQDVEQASSSEESGSLQLSSLSTDTDVSLHIEEISTGRHKEKENFV